ncbi:tol-pal system protein YbgF [Natronocella acetinitrilica]|uniref:Cell division coordinator CpoB n=1 Tax=Natronocella acetinitrilica TaxID=414046 RepID=A0AAE3G1Z2_9GAMM|nr:tol-pal system protein YbgF [Natronocella acetinitrilica]MCP1674094.1 tol-pal system protein YbgF [Natronocella acetinitrilica]
MTTQPISVRIALGAALVAGLACGTATADTQQRLDRIERLLESSSLLDMDRNQQQLQREFAELRGEVDVMQRQLEELRQQQRNLYEDLDTRLRNLERDGGSGGGSADSDLIIPDASVDDDLVDLPPATPSLEDDLASASAEEDEPESELLASEAQGNGDAGAAEEDYQRAFDLLREGRYQAAGNAFSQVADNHAGTIYADNARYWLGETYYVVRDFDAAMEHFTAVAENDDNNKQPDARLKIGFIHYERQQWDRARQTLEQVRDEHAGTTVATLAEDRLRQMRDAGR